MIGKIKSTFNLFKNKRKIKIYFNSFTISEDEFENIEKINNIATHLLNNDKDILRMMKNNNDITIEVCFECVFPKKLINKKFIKNRLLESVPIVPEYRFLSEEEHLLQKNVLKPHVFTDKKTSRKNVIAPIEQNYKDTLYRMFNDEKQR